MLRGWVGEGRLRQYLPLMVFMACINIKVTSMHSYWQCLEEKVQRRECISGFVFWVTGLVDVTLMTWGVAVHGPKAGVAVLSGKDPLLF